MLETEGVIVIEGVNEIETVAIAWVVHVPTPDTTVYVVLVFGATVTFAKLAGFAPTLAVQVNGPAPVADKLTFCPKHIVDETGVTVTGIGGFTVTVPVPITVVGVLAGFNPLTVTVYTVVTEGETTIV